MSSVRLDAVRGLAALSVLLYHAKGLFLVDFGKAQGHSILVKALYSISRYGHEAVVVFFVLSGFLISGSIINQQQKGKWSTKSYAVNRLTRLYVVLVPVLLITAILDMQGLRLFGSLGTYGGPTYGVFTPEPVSDNLTWVAGLGNLFFLQGVLVPTFGSDSPLWSLSYEFWYYVVFPMLVTAYLSKGTLFKRAAWVLASALILLFVGKNISTYFLIWLMGTLLCLLRPMKVKNLLPLQLLTGAAFLVSLPILKAKAPNAVISDFGVGVMFCVFLYTLLHDDGRTTNTIWARAAKTVSGFSYTLYLIHMPILIFLAAWLIGTGERWQPSFRGVCGLGLVMAGLIGVAWGLAELTEKRTSGVREWVMSRVG